MASGRIGEKILQENMGGYYSDKLSAQRLRLCYEIAPPRVRQYLEAEIAFVLEGAERASSVLELGCGYGRILDRLLAPGRELVGIDTSLDSLRLAAESIGPDHGCRLIAMNAASLGFGHDLFDLVLCLQNGLSAFRVNQRAVVTEAIRVTRPGGSVFLSSYLKKFWVDRLAWFRLQSEEGLLGEIDEDATGDGIIVCSDGFVATTLDRDDFARLLHGLDVDFSFLEIDDSCLFCTVTVR